MTVGTRIKEARERAGLSRPQLADLAGVPYPTLAGLENGDQKDSTKLPAIAAALGVNPVWLSSGKGSRVLNSSATSQTENKSQGETGPASQSAGLDRATLHEALTLLFYDELHAGDYTPHARTDRLAELYGWVAEDGGRLTKSRNAAFVQQVSERNQKAGVSSGTVEPTRRKSRPGTSGH